VAATTLENINVLLLLQGCEGGVQTKQNYIKG
jgi:hypothetical protein